MATLVVIASLAYIPFKTVLGVYGQVVLIYPVETHFTHNLAIGANYAVVALHTAQANGGLSHDLSQTLGDIP